jgi:hypothetical protein
LAEYLNAYAYNRNREKAQLPWQLGLSDLRQITQDSFINPFRINQEIITASK